MSDPATVLVGLAAALAAIVAPGLLPLAALGATVLVALVALERVNPWRRTGAAVLGAALVLLVGLRAHQDLAGLARALPHRVDGPAELASDPENRPWGTRVVLVAQGRRWSAEVPRTDDAAVRDLLTGDRVVVHGSTSAVSAASRDWAVSRHIAGRLHVDAVTGGGSTPVWFAAANVVHRDLQRASTSLPDGLGPLFLGLVVGDDRGQDDTAHHRFRAAGLTHLLVVSGENLSVLMVALAPLLVRLPLHRRWVLGAATTAAFVLVTRAEPSVLRAAAMALVALAASVLGRSAPGVRVVALAVVALLVGDPLLVRSVGFQLSVAATLGLVLFHRPLTDRLAGPLWMRRPAAVTLAAQAGALPVIALTFGALPAVCVPANLLAEPAAAATMAVGLPLGLLAGAVREPLAGVVMAPVTAAVWWVDVVARTAARLSVPWLGLPGVVVLVAGVAAAVRLVRRRGAPRPLHLAVALVPFVAVLRPARGPVHDLPGGASAEESPCGWVVHLDRSPSAPRVEDLADALSAGGIARIVAVEPDSATARALREVLGIPAAAERSPPCDRPP